MIGQSPRRAVPHARGLPPLLHEIRDADHAHLRQIRESAERRVVPAHFKREIRAADADLLRQRLLGDGSLLSNLSQFHGGSLG